MKSIKDYIQESFVNEGVKLDKLDIEEVLLLFWEAWSGYTDPRKTGLSGNPRAQHLQDYAIKRAMSDRKATSKSACNLLISVCCGMNKEACEKAGVAEFTRDHHELEKVREEMKKIISDNTDLLLAQGEVWSE